jgi:hypothetical protein
VSRKGQKTSKKDGRRKKGDKIAQLVTLLLPAVKSIYSHFPKRESRRMCARVVAEKTCDEKSAPQEQIGREYIELQNT